MAHELSIRSNNTAEMAYVGATPWHGLGQVLTEGASIEDWKIAAGFDWSIQRGTIRYATERLDDMAPASALRTFPERVVLFRSDTKAPLSTVSKDYQVVQPGAMLEFFRDLVEGAGFKLETAGMLFGGKRMWALARVTEDATIVGQDTVGGFLLLSTACDGTMATTGRFITIRVVCQNTLSMALNQSAKGIVKINHSSVFDADAMKTRLGIGRGQFAKFLDAARDLSASKIGNTDAENFVAKLLLDTKAVTTSEKTTDAVQKAVRESAAFGSILQLFKGNAMGGTLMGTEGTMWGVVNAVTEYVDHHSRAQTQSNRLNRAWFGKGDDLKTAALQAAIAL